jgi:A/G-specific adenine glycosylase
VGLAAVASDWYADNARDLPWRRPGTTPYQVLVSEVMLQQTPVARVVPAYEEWVARWPTAAALAAAPSGEAVRQWGRLGYPRRALRLHAACVAVVEEHDGRLPTTVAALQRLPGVGTYTARALAAFAFRQRVPVVDVNVARVVARVCNGAADGPVSVSARHLAEVDALLPHDPEQAAVASIAFMELGALICTARAPRCADCPATQLCAWRRAGSPVDPAAPSRPVQRYAGTDRQVRGRLLAALRDAAGPVSQRTLDGTWPEPVQRARALDGLVADGLVVPVGRGRYALPS